MLTRIGLQSTRLFKTGYSIRSYASFTPMKPSSFPPLEKTMLKEALEARHHAADSVAMWKKINLFLVIPATALVAWYCIPKELDHMHHLHEHPNEFVAYPYLRKRKNPFPWGDDSLFHNPVSNAKPE